MTQTGSSHICSMCWLNEGLSDSSYFFQIYIYKLCLVFNKENQINCITYLKYHWLSHFLYFISFRMYNDCDGAWQLQRDGEGVTNIGESPVFMYFPCTILQHWTLFLYMKKKQKHLFLEIETELEPEYLCITQSSHIPDVLCLSSPPRPPHSSLNNMILYNPSVYLSLLIFVRLPKPSNICPCQKKHGPDLPATLTISEGSLEHPYSRPTQSNGWPVLRYC